MIPAQLRTATIIRVVYYIKGIKESVHLSKKMLKRYRQNKVTSFATSAPLTRWDISHITPLCTFLITRKIQEPLTSCHLDLKFDVVVTSNSYVLFFGCPGEDLVDDRAAKVPKVSGKWYSGPSWLYHAALI